MGSPSLFLTYKKVKTKCRVFLETFHVSMVTYYVTIVGTFLKAIIGVLYGIIALLLRYTTVL